MSPMYPPPPQQAPDPQQALTPILSDPRAAPGQRAAALAGLQGMSAGKGQSQAPAPAMPPLPPVNVQGAIQDGMAMADGPQMPPMPQFQPQMMPGAPMRAMARGGAVRGYADGGEVDDPELLGAGLGTMDPRFMAQIRAMMQQEEAPTSEDKGLALAQFGFGLAASPSPHFGQALGEGGMQGLAALQQMKQQRALQAMKAASLAGSLTTGADRVAAQRESIRQRADAAKESADARRYAADAAADARRDAAAAYAGSRQDSAAALAESRYTQADLNRQRQYQQTGNWVKIAGDEERGVVGPPATGEYEGPLVTSPKISPKAKQALELAKPAQDQQASLMLENLNMLRKDAEGLLTHKGLSNAVGFGGKTVSLVPGTEAKNFASRLETLKSNTFVSTLQAMRNASKTGGAVGNVSDREGDKLAVLLAPLDQAQTEDQFKQALRDIVDYADRTGRITQKEYVATYGDKSAPKLPWEKDDAATPPPAPPPAGAPPKRPPLSSFGG